MRLLVTGILICALTMVAGCSAVQNEKVARYSFRRAPSPPKQAPTDGRYGLYSTIDTNPQVIYPLKEGDRIGFIGRDDKRWAVAGTNEIPIERSPTIRGYYWRRMDP